MSKTRQKILIVEDEPAILTGLVDVFVFHGYIVETSCEGNEALKYALTGNYDLILLDVMLPGMDGFEICRRIRQENKQQAIIMLTARSGDDEIIHGLSLGADDYIAKPFSIAQLVLRVKAVLRRTHTEEELSQTINIGSTITIDPINLSGVVEKQDIVFTKREIEVFLYLYKHKQRPVAREELLYRVWGYSKELQIETRTVDIHIAKLRRKLEPDSKSAKVLVTIRGAGYRLFTD